MPGQGGDRVERDGFAMLGRTAEQRRRSLRSIVFAAALTVILLVLAHRSGVAAPDNDAPTAHIQRNPATAPAGVPIDAAAFAAGSCEGFAPTSGDRHLTVFLDAGHGGPDPGGQGVTQTGTAIDERQLTLPVVLDAAAVLRAEGFRVVVSRTTNSPVVRLEPGDLSNGLFSLSGEHRDTAARPLCADLAHASVLVSVHFNIGSSPANAGTLTTYDASRTFAAQNLRLANLIQKDLVQAFRTQPGWHVPDDGVVTDNTVGNALTSRAAAYGHLLQLGPASPGYFTTPSTMPGALTEPLFLTDPFEGSVAASTKGQHLMAGAIASAVTAFLATG
jgi:N-acetylmuramoyl-L-alanine amidase